MCDRGYKLPINRQKCVGKYRGVSVSGAFVCEYSGVCMAGGSVNYLTEVAE